MKTYKKLCIDNSTIKIYRQYEKKFQQFRYSYDIQTPIGWMCNGGFGLNNQITHPTYESILQAALNTLNLPKETIRQYKLETILTEQNDN
jgi:hypothetical protein